MISYSFSPNWYRTECLGFSQKKSIFYYCSNCIVYKYDLERKIILSQVNIKDWLIKNQSYKLGRMNAEKQQVGGERQSVKSSNREKQHGERLKINCIELVQDGLGEDILIIGLNCMGLVLIVSSSNIDGHLKVQSTIDLHKQTGSQIQAVQYIHVHQKNIVSPNDTHQQKSKEKNKIFDIVIFSSQGIKVNLKLTIAKLDKKEERVCQQLGKVDVDSWIKLIDSSNKGKKGRYLQVKTIAKEQIQIHNSLINQNNTSLQQLDQSSITINAIFLSHSLQTQIDSTPKCGNIILYDSTFNKILSLTSVDQLRQSIKHKNESSQQKDMISKQCNNETILSVDFLKGQDQTKYIVLAKINHTNKHNPFCQTFHLYVFYSSQLLSSISKKLNQELINKKPNQESINENLNQETISTKRIGTSTGMISTKLQIIYPKKCHHKLSQQQKSTLCIKLINQNYAVMTGRLGEMIILSLKQIQLQLSSNPSLTITIRPYSYQEEANNLFRIQHSQRHYKDIYAIYRVGEEEYYRKHNNEQQSKTNHKLYFIGTDHILTQWQHSTNPQIEINNQKLLKYESNLKFLTSSVDQIILSQLQPSLVFLRLRDSNIRSFQPYSDRSYWLNQFWKHTNVSFCKKVQKLIMHPKDIGVACLVNDQGKIIFYDIYEERLIRLIEITKKTMKKIQENGQSSKCNDNDNKFRNQHNKKPYQQKQQHQREKCIQINSISFQHISIIQCLQSLSTLNNNDNHKQGSSCLKEQFQVKSQQFYDKELDKETVIMIQSNELILILMEGVKQGRYMKIEVYKKAFKLQRIYKTKYWDGNVMIGTRKKKGQLMVNVGMRYVEQNNQQHKQLIVKSLQKEIDLPLGVSSRYIFKLCEVGVNNSNSNGGSNSNGNGGNYSNSNGGRGYFLIVINYKGNKLYIALYRITVQGKEQPIQLTKLLVSQQITIPNISSSTHQTSINIQHLIISQQPNQFLIGVYNNATQTITIIDYSQIVTSVVDEKETIHCEKLIHNQVEQHEEQNRQLFSYKRSLHQCLAQNNIKNQKQNQQYQQQQSKDKHSMLNFKTSSSQTLKIHLYQFSGLSYKIENMMFNSVFSQKEISQISHLIILGKDQSVRLLNLNCHMHLNGPMMAMTQNMNQGQQYPYKVQKRSILMRAKMDGNRVKE